jgi:hypothetical protein
MSSFDEMGKAQLLAYEGQRQVAVAIADVVKRALLNLVGLIARSSPGPFVP